MAEVPPPTTVWQIRADLAWARGLLWFATGGGRWGEPKPDVHIFLADRYARLAAYHAKLGAMAKAKELSLQSDFHYRAGGLDDPPRAVAIAMPVPGTNPIDLVSRTEAGGDDVA